MKLPSREEFKLPNGLTVIVAKDSRFPLLTVRLAFLAGSKYDPQDLPGLSENVAALLNQGTALRSARQIAEQAADLGGQIAAFSHHDDLTVSGSCLSTTAPEFSGSLPMSSSTLLSRKTKSSCKRKTAYRCCAVSVPRRAI